MAVMSESNHFRIRGRGVSWRSALCLLLAVLFLYSPFFTIYGSSQVPNVRNTFSFRGTVGSSELRRFTISSIQISCDPPEQAIFAGLAIFAAPTSFGPAAMFGRAIVPPQLFLAKTYSRPPPVR